MKLTNRTYQVYICKDQECGVIQRGNKKEMTALYEACKADPELYHVELMKYSVPNYWIAIEKYHKENK